MPGTDTAPAPVEFDDSYKWSALANTTAATFMAVLLPSTVLACMWKTRTFPKCIKIQAKDF